jgi:hypothetical protein
MPDEKSNGEQEPKTFNLSELLRQRPSGTVMKTPDGKDKTLHYALAEALWIAQTEPVANGILADRIERQQPASVQLWKKDRDRIKKVLEAGFMPFLVFPILSVIDAGALQE